MVLAPHERERLIVYADHPHIEVLKVRKSLKSIKKKLYGLYGLYGLSFFNDL